MPPSQDAVPRTVTLMALLGLGLAFAASLLVFDYLPQAFLAFPLLLAGTAGARLIGRAYRQREPKPRKEAEFEDWVRACILAGAAALLVALCVTMGVVDGSIGVAVSAYVGAAVCFALAVHTRYVSNLRHRERTRSNPASG